MLTVFYFDHEFFGDESLNISTINSGILEAWQKYGCLAVCQNDGSDIRKAIQKINPKYQQKWMAAFTSSSFKKMRVSIENPILSSLEDLNDFKEVFYPNGIVTGVIDSGYHGLFDPACIAVDQTQLEIVTPSNFDESVNFKSSKVVSEKDIGSSEEYSEIWGSRFSGLAAQTSVITVIDRYMAINIQRDISAGLKPSIERFVESLSLEGKDYSLHFYSACDFSGEDVNCTALGDYINNTLKAKPYFSSSRFEVSFSICKDSIFRSAAHDRMLCFDDHVVQIGRGMDIFREVELRNNTFTIKSKNSSGFDRIYKELNRNREWRYKP